MIEYTPGVAALLWIGLVGSIVAAAVNAWAAHHGAPDLAALRWFAVAVALSDVTAFTYAIWSRDLAHWFDFYLLIQLVTLGNMFIVGPIKSTRSYKRARLGLIDIHTQLREAIAANDDPSEPL